MTREAVRSGLALLRLKWWTTRNRLKLSGKRHPLRLAVQCCLILPTIAGFTLFLTYGLSQAFQQAVNQRDQTSMLASILMFFILGSFVGVSTAALQSLYLAEDVAFLTALPISLRAIYSAKMLDAAAGALLPSVLAISGVAGFGLAHSFSATSLIAAPLSAIALLAITCASAVTFVSFVTRFVPPKRARVYLLSTAFALVALSSFAWRLFTPQPHEPGALGAARSLISWTPPGWAAKAISSSSAGSLRETAIWCSLVSVSALMLTASGYVVFKRVYLGSLDRAASLHTGLPGRRALAPAVAARAGMASSPFAALVLKEWLTLVRDLRRMSGVIWPTLVVLFYAAVLNRGGKTSGLNPALGFWIANGSLALLPWGLSLGLSIYAFGSEGRNVALLRTLPVSPRQLFLAKTISSLLPIALVSIATASLTLALRGARATEIAEMAALVAWMSVGYVTIDTAASAVAPRFDIAHIQRAIGLTGRAFGLVAGGAFGLLTIVMTGRLLFFVYGTPADLNMLLKPRIGSIRPLGWPLALIAGAAAIAVAQQSMRIGVNRVERLIREGD